jgi:hypothetical protein
MINSIWRQQYREANPLTPYEPAYLFRVGVLAVMVVSLAVVILAQTGALCHFTQAMTSLFNYSVAVWKPIAIAAAAVVLGAGTVIVIQQARQNLANGKIGGRDHWRSCYIYTNESRMIRKAFLDMSQVKNGNGRARLYTKETGKATQSAMCALPAIPFYTIGVILYHLGRLVAVPIHILNNLTKYSLIDIPKEMAHSIGRILTAVFYGTALFCAALYAILDPLNGMKLGSAIEDKWNGQQRDSFYLVRSWLPEAEVVFENDQITQIDGVDGWIELLKFLK